MTIIMQVDNLGNGRLRVVTKQPTIIELMQVDGKIFVSSERYQTPQQNAAPAKQTASNEPSVVQAAK